MISLTAEQAFQAYEAVRHRLPPAGCGDLRHRQIETLEEIADAFDVFLLDAFGVLNIGETAIPGTPRRVANLQAAGKRVLVVSNAASVPVQELQAKYRRLGYDFPPSDIVTSRAALAAGLRGRAGLRWGAMTASGTRLDDLGVSDVIGLEDDPATYRAVEGFLLVGSAGWTDTRQRLLEDAIGENPRPVLVGNPDIVAPRETGFSAEPGYFAHRLADRTGLRPEFYGKPFANIYDLAFARIGPVDRARVVMVGDSLHTDILGARTAGVASALVAAFGFFAGLDVENAIRRTGIVPDYVVRRP